MGLTERHWFEDEEPELTEQQLEDMAYENKKAYANGYVKGFHDAKTGINWHKDKTNLPSEGSLVDVIISYNGPNERVGLLCGFVQNGRIVMPAGSGENKLDLTDEAIMWRKVPNLIIKEDGLIYWKED